MSRWWRAYEKALDDPKLQRLSADLFRFWFNLMCVASQDDGKLPTLPDIAFKLRLAEPRCKRMMEELQRCRLIDETPDGTLSPHNWEKWQYKSDVSTERVRKFRKRKNIVSGNGSETFHETPPETDSEQKQIQSRKEDAADAAPADLEKQFFQRGKAVLGQNAGGLLARLLAAKDKNVALARAAVEQASTKDDPREYVGAIIRGQNPSDRQQVDPRL